MDQHRTTLGRRRWRAGHGAATGFVAVGLAVVGLALTACGPAPGAEPTRDGDGRPALQEARAAEAERAAAALRLTLDRSVEAAAAIEDALRPVPLLRPAEEAVLRTHLNAAHVARARALGVRPADEAELRALVDAGRLVALEASTPHWVVREQAQERAYVTPDVPPLLVKIAERFQATLADHGIPPYRLEITSVLRTAADQAALRQRNPNAAAGVSSHEFGTTLDIAYESFAPPLELPDGLVADGPAAMQVELHQVAALALETVGARKSREMQAFLGHALMELQAAGDVLVILERLQPVYHITVGRRLAGG
jgi:hypothetical protein